MVPIDFNSREKKVKVNRAQQQFELFFEILYVQQENQTHKGLEQLKGE